MKQTLLIFPALFHCLIFGSATFAADLKKGWREWRPLAEQGIAEAQSNLGWMYEEGKGVLQNYKMAVKLWTLAAEQGLAQAQTNLGVMYGTGDGALQDFVRAHMWFNIAALSGDKNAAKGLNIVVQKMTPSQIKKAQNLARQCVKKNYKGC